MNTLSIKYPPEVLWALQQEPKEFEREARLLRAIKLYENGKLTTGTRRQDCGRPACYLYSSEPALGCEVKNDNI